jgi:hypothetical protein
MDQNTQRTFFHTDTEPDPTFSPPRVDYRTELNNWLQVNGGTERLDWKSFRVGPENNTIWTVICLSTSPVSHLLSF